MVKLTHREYLKADRDYIRTAQISNLVYVKDDIPGIIRRKKGKGYSYLFEGKAVKDPEERMRIRSLVIPPAWEKVWICPFPNGHIQATGYDLRSRKQYIYHQRWSQLRHETKFHRVLEFGKRLPELRCRLEKDIRQKTLNRGKVLATVISLMERTYIRVGNYNYEKENKTYGLTTLKDNHVTIDNEKIHFSFKGKKGIPHTISLRNKKLARIVKECRDIPGRELFQYYDENGIARSIDSGMVNDYIREACGDNFTAKDFRTWAGCVTALEVIRTLEPEEKAKSRKGYIPAILDQVSIRLGNTRSVCKKYYVHPEILRLYEEEKLDNYLKEMDEKENSGCSSPYTFTEDILLKILSTAAPAA